MPRWRVCRTSRQAVSMHAGRENHLSSLPDECRHGSSMQPEGIAAPLSETSPSERRRGDNRRRYLWRSGVLKPEVEFPAYDLGKPGAERQAKFMARAGTEDKDGLLLKHPGISLEVPNPDTYCAHANRPSDT